MKACLIQCVGRCKQQVWVLAPVLDNDGFPGVYCCPVCKDKNVKNLIKPFEAKIIIKKEANGEVTSLASNPGQGEAFSIEQFRGGGRGDHEPGEGAPEEPKEQISVGDVAPGTKPSKYEEEICKYFGVAADSGC